MIVAGYTGALVLGVPLGVAIGSRWAGEARWHVSNGRGGRRHRRYCAPIPENVRENGRMDLSKDSYRFSGHSS